MTLVCILLLFIFVQPWWTALIWSLLLLAVKALIEEAAWRWG